jgi:hypothetical protein
MRGLLGLILTFCLFAGLATGAVAHAAELAGDGEVAAAAQWPHAEGDHDQVPADSDRNVPHHHSICHGHDLAAAAKAGGPAPFVGAALPRPAAEAPPAGAMPGSPLRPPIA